jgi:hypothetical protein
MTEQVSQAVIDVVRQARGLPVQGQKAPQGVEGQDVQRDERGRFAPAQGESSTPDPEAESSARGRDEAEEQRVPYDRFAKVNSENKTLKAERDRFAAELEAVRKEKRKAARENLMQDLEALKEPPDFDDWEPKKQARWYAAEAAKRNLTDPEQIAEYEEVRDTVRAAKALGLPLGPQLDAVLQVFRDTNGRWDFERCLRAARADQPDLFPDTDRASAPAGQPVGPKAQEPSRTSRGRAHGGQKKIGDAIQGAIDSRGTGGRRQAMTDLVTAMREQAAQQMRGQH